jgi:hypothetical protein
MKTTMAGLSNDLLKKVQDLEAVQKAQQVVLTCPSTIEAAGPH